MVKTPTNTDIMRFIEQNHGEVINRLSAVELQVKLTNGRVKDLEVKREREDAVDEYKKKNVKPSFNWWSLVPYGVGLAIALIAIGSELSRR